MAKQTRIPEEAQDPDNWDMEFTSGLLKVEPQQLYKVLARRSNGTCTTCDGMDERIFQKKDAVAGENFPPFHPNCVCQAVDYDGNRLTAEGLQAEAEQQEVKEYFEELTDEERFVMTALTDHLRKQGDRSLGQLENFLKGDFSSSWKGEPMSVHIKSASISEEQTENIGVVLDALSVVVPPVGAFNILYDMVAEGDPASAALGAATFAGGLHPSKKMQKASLAVGAALTGVQGLKQP